MYSTYAVRVIDGVKHRHFVGAFANEFDAKHMANCATCGNATYAYVKDSKGGTIFYLPAPDPNVLYGRDTIPLEKCRPVGQAPAA